MTTFNKSDPTFEYRFVHIAEGCFNYHQNKPLYRLSPSSPHVYGYWGWVNPNLVASVTDRVVVYIDKDFYKFETPSDAILAEVFRSDILGLY